MPVLSYQEALDYLFSKLPMFQRIGPPAFKKSLEKTRLLMERLGNPQDRLRCIHIAGTNGKGSVAHMLAAICQSAGYKVGLHTSPHYLDFRERIKLNGALAPKSFVIDFVWKHQSFIEELGPSFFEVSVGMAFQYFVQEKVDIAVIETGLGGRLDSTNVVTPLLSIITNIGYDHQQFLGDTLPEIAGEKAGIIKAGIPVLIGESQEEVRHVFEQKAELEQSPLFFADGLIQVEKAGGYEAGQVFNVKKNSGSRVDGLRLEASGAYQQKNLATVLAALELLKPTLKVEEKNIREGLEDLRNLTRFLGRWQVLGNKPIVVADSAHNRDGVRYAMDQLATYDYRRLHMVWGMVADKDQAPILALLPKEAVYYFVRPDIPRGLDAEELREKGRVAGLKGKSYGSVKKGMAAALEQASEKDMVFIGGSIFVVAEVL